MKKKILTPLRFYHDKNMLYIYYDYLKMFSHLDIIAIPLINQKTLNYLAHYCDGLLLTGGLDIDPSYYHQPLHPKTKIEQPELEKQEFTLIKLFAKQKKPILGICRGLQTINVAFNGTLFQDISPNHLQPNKHGYCHFVTTTKDTLIQKYLGTHFLTNSFHHQAIDKLADNFKISAISDDFVIEAIEKDNIIAFQWHPEKNDDKIKKAIIKLFDDLLEAKR